MGTCQKKGALSMYREAVSRRKTRRKKHICLAWLVAALVVCLTVGILRISRRDPESPGVSKGSSLRSVDVDTQPQAVPAPAQAEPTDTASPRDAWNLVLVNPWNPLPESYSVTTVALQNGQAVDERCYPDLQEMMDDCRAAGLSPVICSSYRTWEKQESLYNNLVNKRMAQGYSAEEARAAAGTEIAVPGTSEHQSGLAVDIVDLNNQNLDNSQEDTAVQKWLMEHCWEYGFILRYPRGKSEVTGISYEPWHYRYVGKEAAKEIVEAGICPEEYIAPQ